MKLFCALVFWTAWTLSANTAEDIELRGAIPSTAVEPANPPVCRAPVRHQPDDSVEHKPRQATGGVPADIGGPSLRPVLPDSIEVELRLQENSPLAEPGDINPETSAGSAVIDVQTGAVKFGSRSTAESEPARSSRPCSAVTK